MSDRRVDSAFHEEFLAIRNDHYSDSKSSADRRARFHQAVRTILPYEDLLDDDDIAEQVRADQGDDGVDFVYEDPHASPHGKLVCIQVKDQRKMALAAQRDALKLLVKGIEKLQSLRSGSGLSDGRREHFKRVKRYKDKPLDYILILTGDAASAADQKIVESVAVTPPNSVRVIDRRGLQELSERIRNPPPCSVRLTWRGGHLLDAGPHDTPRVIMGWLPCGDYVRATKEHGNALFRLNPRLFLGASRPNTGMRKTLENRDGMQRDWFHLLNNGMTAVCDSMTLKRIADGATEIEFANFQVVNGCQSTETLWRVADDAEEQLDGAWISLRVIEGDAKLGGLVSKCTNSQSAITDADQRANDDCQRKVKDCLEGSTNDPVFYEARRGEWTACRSKKKFKRSFGDTRDSMDSKITMKELAQALLSVIGEPHKAKEQIVSIFKEGDATYKQLFEECWTDSAQLLLVADLFRFVSTIGNWILETSEEPERQVARLGRYVLTFTAYEYLKHGHGAKMFRGSFNLIDATKSQQLRRGFPETLEPVLQEALAALTDAIQSSGGDARATLRGKDPIQMVQETIRKQLQSWERDQQRAEKRRKKAK